jgi:hypothetical protein
MNKALALCAMILSLSALTAFAEDFRCPNGKIISTGDSISAVSIKCDPPFATTRREEPVQATVATPGGPGTRYIYIEVQEWTYKAGSTLLHTLIFRNGILAEVQTGEFAR